MALSKAAASRLSAAALAFSVAHTAMPLYAQTVASSAPTESAGQTITTQKPATPAQGEIVTSWSIGIDPMLPLGIIGGLGLLYGAGCVMAARRGVKGAWLRAAAGGALVVTLVNPEIITERHEKIPTEIVVVVDKSASQKMDGRDQTTGNAYDDLIRELSKIEGANIRTIELKDDDASIPADGTPLFRALRDGLADVPRDRLGAVFMLTDGIVHDVPLDKKAVQSIVGANVPVHTLVSGREGEVDRRIVLEKSPRYSLVNTQQAIRFRVVEDGAAPGTAQPVRVTISHDGRELETRMVVPGQSTEIKVTVPKAGSNIIELKADALDGETTIVNNRASATVEGVRETLNVLLVSGTPDANMRMWRDLIKSDPDVNLVQFSILRPPEKQDNTPLKEMSMISLPAHELFAQKLNEFDVVIFDHYAYDGLVAAPYLENVVRYVNEGGSVMIVAGEDFAGDLSLARTPLADILPAQSSGQAINKPFAPKISETGERHPVTRALMNPDGTTPAWGSWLQSVGVSSPRGRVLMTGADGRPLLILNKQGEGRVAMLTSDNAWLWARGYQGGGPHQQLLRGVSQWLSSDPAMAEENLRMQRDGGNVIVEQQTMADNPASVTVRTPSGKTVQMTPESYRPGLWRAIVPASEFGVYRAEQAGAHPAKAYLNVGPENSREYEQTISTMATLKQTADMTDGRIIRMAGADGRVALSPIYAYRAAREDRATDPKAMNVPLRDVTVSRGASGSPLLPAWAGLVLLIGLLAAAWSRESDLSLFSRDTWRRRPPSSPPNELKL